MSTKIFSTIKDQVYTTLREEIFAGRFSAGQRLQEVELAEELHVSRTPVREALRQLVHDGIAVEIPNKGVFVRGFTLKDVEEIFNMRVLLEGHAIDLLDGKLDEGAVEMLKNTVQKMEQAYNDHDLDEYSKWDASLHDLYISLSGNNMLNIVYQGVQTLIMQFRVQALSGKARFVDSLSEHTDTVDAILSGDFAKAKEINRHHLEMARDELLKTVRE